MATIPVVDFSALSLSIADEDKLSEVDVKTTADQMINAFTNIGFVYLSNTGFPRQLVSVDLLRVHYYYCAKYCDEYVCLSVCLSVCPR